MTIESKNKLAGILFLFELNTESVSKVSNDIENFRHTFLTLLYKNNDSYSKYYHGQYF